MAPPNNEDRMYTALAKSMVDDILQATDVSGMIPWCLIGEKMGTSVFRSELGSVGPVNVHGSREFEISAGDLMSSLSSFSTRTYCSMMKKIRSDEFIDGVILKTILSKSEDFPFRFMAIKSMKVKSSNPLKRAKEYVYLEVPFIITMFEKTYILLKKEFIFTFYCSIPIYLKLRLVMS